MTVSMSAVWDRTTEFLSDRPGALAEIAVFTLFVPTAIEGIAAPLKVNATPALALGLGLMALAFFVVSLWGQLAITALALDPDGGGAWSRATRRLGPMILVWVVLLAIGFLLFVPVLGILAANGIDPARVTQPGLVQALTPGAAGAIGLYALVLLPIALWLIARIVVLSTAVVVAEPVALGALRRSFRLTRGLALKIIGVLLLYGVVTWVATLAAETVVGALLHLLLDGDGPITVASVLTALVAAIVATIFSVIGTVFVAQLYLAAHARDAVAATA